METNISTASSQLSLQQQAYSNFRWLTWLRWAAVTGQLATILCVYFFLHTPLPLAELFTVIAIEALSNVVLVYLGRKTSSIPPTAVISVMLFDICALTLLLYYGGGSSNPFSFLYLVHIALAALVVSTKAIWMITGFAGVCSALLFFSPASVGFQDPAQHQHHQHMMQTHLHGMWVAFIVASAFIAYFVNRIARELEEQRKMAFAERAKSIKNEQLASLATLAAGTAHELSTPLSTIAVVAKELEHAATETGHQELVDDASLIRTQVDRCRRIMQQLAAHSHDGFGEQWQSTKPKEVASMAIRELVNPQMVRIHSNSETDERCWETAPQAAANALKNIIDNALQASALDQMVELNISVNDEQVSFAVIDHGHGFSEHALAHIGEPFFTTKEPGDGTGLGFFLSKAIVEKLGGRLEITETSERGSTVALIYPREADMT